MVLTPAVWEEGEVEKKRRNKNRNREVWPKTPRLGKKGEVLDGIHDEVLSTGRSFCECRSYFTTETETETVPTKYKETEQFTNKSTKGSRHQQSLTEASHDLDWTHAFTHRAWRALHYSTKHQPDTASKVCELWQFECLNRGPTQCFHGPSWNTRVWH